MTALRAEQVSVVFPSESGEVHALDNADLSISEGEFVVALGASGCGKTTLLNLLAGFLQPTQGRISFGDREITGPGADRAVVFQKHALLPWLNVLDNVAFGLMLQGVPKAKRYATARHFISALGLEGFESKAIYELSGGMQQRVGVARALAADPEVLLMDEPLAALDALTRERVQEILLKAWSESGKMAFFITHSVEEALFLATRIILMSPRPGRITHVYETEFSKQYLKTGNSREIKASREFIDMREDIMRRIQGDAG
ncbi:taurine ABC transporter ATP-binding protein [Spiribacter halobius]|uniref:Nitrate ABC transporter ATP-binding protein n=1 Tax=Sediminicurvatus halobius TaxID=2182432 RepID=A0A2U2MY64_9GAMM|nr:ATP-binding cassette domain-containing protein [Spiribacter halobius]PWG61886.1 nitrate ABC transporter ATP-binding protein [Spiribacter halobius]UEX79238.1 ATP-binding cassette domain-containing protein [Spiribacter halobius]